MKFIIFTFLLYSIQVFAVDSFSAIKEALNQGNYKEAFSIANTNCQKNDAAACYALGGLYFQGKGVDKDVNKAVVLTQKACNSGYSKACRQLAKLYTKGQVIEQNLLEAKNLYKRACKDLKDARSCYEYAVLTIEDASIKKTEDNSLLYFTDSCKLNKSYCKSSGEYLEKHNYINAALILYDIGCEEGDIKTCSYVGNLYYKGTKYIDVNNFKAREYFEKACYGDVQKNCSNTDYDKQTNEFLTNYCVADVKMSCTTLGLMYDKGQGVRQNSAQALEYYKKSCELGEGIGCLLLGLHYSETDRRKALKYFGKSCDNQYEDGCKTYSEKKALWNIK